MNPLSQTKAVTLAAALLLASVLPLAGARCTRKAAYHRQCYLR